jgi:hypothetical protein
LALLATTDVKDRKYLRTAVDKDRAGSEFAGPAEPVWEVAAALRGWRWSGKR